MKGNYGLISVLSFGYGNHACPGRFIAIRLLKMMLCRLLLQYEFEWDFKGPGDEPARFVIEGASLPNITQKIRVRRRT
jgi:cytochrome P450